MKKCVTLLMAAAFVVTAVASGLCETLFVDNREESKVYPERLNMRSAPEKNGALLGLYYTGTEVNVLNVENDEYAKVEIGGMTGYMAREYLITSDEVEKRYGTNSGFGDGRAAEVDLNGLWMTSIALREQPDPASASLATLSTGDRVGLLGILDNWAYVKKDAFLGYIPLDTLTDVDALKVSIVSSGKADEKTILYDAPNKRGKAMMRLGNGTACFNLFGRKEGEWLRVRVGGISGWIKYTQAQNLKPLGDSSRSVVPYYPLLMQTKYDTLLYSVAGDKNERYMTLGEGMKVEVLAECDDYVYVRTYECGAGAFHCGDFGYVLLSDLSLTAVGDSIGIAQVDDGDLPVLLLHEPDKDAAMIGALCGGAQIRITSYTQTDYVQVALGGLTGYIPKAQIRVLTQKGEELSDRIPQRATATKAFNLHAIPDDRAKDGELVESGQRVYMLGKIGEWAYVCAADTPVLDVENSAFDRTGFVRLDNLDAPASTTHLTAFVSKDKINLREKPSRDGAIIGYVHENERIRIVDYGTTWTGVELEEGKRGYLMTKYLKFE